MALRNTAYDTGLLHTKKSNIPVVSIGNLTTGGTGKSPMVRWMAEQLLSLGHQPGILMRGYGARPGQPGDEEQEFRATLPATVKIVANPDRVAGAETLVQQGADLILLDDGFQHRRLARDLDIVLISGAQGFDHGRILPGGHLREPPVGLARAGCVILTKCESAQPESLARLEDEIRHLAPNALLLRCDMPTDIPAALHAQPVFVTCGIGQPEPFLAEVAKSCRIVGQQLWPDHHNYTKNDWCLVNESAKALGAAAIVTTRKDAVKIPAEWTNASDALPLAVVSVEVRFQTGDGARLMDRLQRIVKP